MKPLRYFLLTLGIIIIDQVVKLLVHFNMAMGSAGEISVFGNWFKLHYILNRGMAFGLRFGFEYGKLSLTIFRLLAMIVIGYILYYLSKKNYHAGLLWSVAAILGGAIGNLIDSIFYGVLLDNAPYDVITPWFHGQVIDMIYLDFWEGYVADWIPFWGGKKVALWPIFNIADVAIFIGVFTILIFQKRFIARSK
ncbi:lipoprotein signal peptidase [Roseivirga misakiensis]|uniref:Lipoprotein signal peptidase n=1 Tax=Roseivirga misakiensis TaxID=1563681 RepID=A0A1E5T662_9BACT|nr:lipoprotein signal peptidase [Roseivirga misakiensis]OEK06882.1 lipoprotein signal peptidase [Roseivirga misakiensis]